MCTANIPFRGAEKRSIVSHSAPETIAFAATRDSLKLRRPADELFHSTFRALRILDACAINVKVHFPFARHESIFGCGAAPNEGQIPFD